MNKIEKAEAAVENAVEKLKSAVYDTYEKEALEDFINTFTSEDRGEVLFKKIAEKLKSRRMAAEIICELYQHIFETGNIDLTGSYELDGEWKDVELIKIHPTYRA